MAGKREFFLAIWPNGRTAKLCSGMLPDSAHGLLAQLNMIEFNFLRVFPVFFPRPFRREKTRSLHVSGPKSQ